MQTSNQTSSLLDESYEQINCPHCTFWYDETLSDLVKAVNRQLKIKPNVTTVSKLKTRFHIDDDTRQVRVKVQEGMWLYMSSTASKIFGFNHAIVFTGEETDSQEPTI